MPEYNIVNLELSIRKKYEELFLVFFDTFDHSGHSLGMFEVTKEELKVQAVDHFPPFQHRRSAPGTVQQAPEEFIVHCQILLI